MQTCLLTVIFKMLRTRTLVVVQSFSCSVVSNSLWPRGPQRARLPILHFLLEFPQIHIHWVGDAIQTSCPQSLSSSPPSISLSQHQGLFQWVCSSHQVAQVLELQLQHQSFQWILRVWLVWSPCSLRDSQESSPALQFEGISYSALNLFYCPALTSFPVHQ